MAEFREVIRQYNRMCETIKKDEVTPCVKCAVSAFNCNHDMTCTELMRKNPVFFEQAVMDWAEEHPEPVYPSWNEAWRQMFPNAVEKSPPCLRYFVNDARFHESCVFGMSCEDCRNKPIPADIAEKLGIKPIGGAE